MKILNLVLLISSLFLVKNTTFNTYKSTNLEDVYQVDGGKISIGFDEEDKDLFNYYTEFDTYPFLMDSKCYAWTLAEQKIVYNQSLFSDVDVSVDTYTINKDGKFDCGIYVQGTNFSNVIDGCSAYCLNLEKGADKNTFYLKLHQFKNSTYAGAKKEIANLKLPTEQLNLRAVVKNGTLYAFVNHESIPRFSYEIGISQGYVGLRSFYSPNYFDNFTVIGEGIPYYKNDIEVMIDKANKLDLSKYTLKTATNLSLAINEARAALDSSNQYDSEEALENLKDAYDDMQELRSFAQLQDAILEASKINNHSEKYTKNSYGALKIVLDICKKIVDGNEDEISYWCCVLEEKISSLIEYLPKEAL